MRYVVFAAVFLAIIAGVWFAESNSAIAPASEEEIVAEGIQEEVETIDADEEQSGTAEDTSAESPTPTPAPAKVPEPQQTQTPAPVPKSAPVISPLPYNALVTYDGGRFFPRAVTIKEGGTVRFLNVSDIGMWVASDQHPIHTFYPIKSDSDCAGSSFDQCISVDRGEYWEFTFTRRGTWGYHNHLRAKDRAEVEVLTEKEWQQQF